MAARLYSLRVVEREREQLAAVLGEQMAQGYLTLAEFYERLDAVYAVRTQPELRDLALELPIRVLPHNARFRYEQEEGEYARTAANACFCRQGSQDSLGAVITAVVVLLALVTRDSTLFVALAAISLIWVFRLATRLRQ